MKLNELMELGTNLQTQVLDLENTKTNQANKIDSLKKRVKRLKKRNRSRTHKLKRLYKVGLTAMVESLNNEQSLDKDASKQGRRISDIYADEGTTLVSTQDDAEMFDVNDDVGGEEVFVARKIEKVIEEVVDAAQGVNATQEYYKLYLMETPGNPFVAPVTIKIIESFMNKVSYQRLVDKVSAFYMKNLAQPWQTMFKVFNCSLTTRTSRHDQTKINIIQLFHAMINQTNVDYATLLWIDEDYHSIKDDIPLVSMYTTWNMLVQGCSNESNATGFLPKERIVQEKLDEEEIKKMVKGDEDEESYASEFDDSMINDYVDYFSTRLEPESYKEYPEIINNDYEEIEKDKKDEEIKKEKKQDAEKIDEVVMEKYDDDDVEKVDKIREFLNHCNKVMPGLTFAKTNEMINKEMLCLVSLAFNKDHEVDPINEQEMISKEFSTHAPKMIEELF
nr:hypothetical protein [Tanacetum cinerariifolium]